jgi:multiple sugar transport system substrate-binding protein
VGLSAKSQNKAAAAAFLESLYTTDASMSWAKVAGLVPDRRSVQSDPFFATPQAETIRIFSGLLDSPGALTFPPNLPDITKLFPVMNTALQELIGTDEAIGAILGRARAALGW